MMNELPHRRPCVCFASLAALTGNRWNPRREAALCLHTQCGRDQRGNARFWKQPSFTSRDDHVESTSRRTAARYASKRSLAFFFGAPPPFLWARPKKWGGKRFYKGLPLFRPAAQGAALRPRPLAGLHTQCGRTQSGAAFFCAEKSCIFYKYGVYKCQPI